MLSKIGQCDQDTARASFYDVEAVTITDRRTGYTHLYISDSSLYSALIMDLYDF